MKEEDNDKSKVIASAAAAVKDLRPRGGALCASLTAVLATAERADKRSIRSSASRKQDSTLKSLNFCLDFGERLRDIHFCPP